MTFSRRNPIGLPLRLPPGLPLVRVGTGAHTHILNIRTRQHLCESGKNAGIAGGSGAVPVIFASDAKAATCYRCIKLAELNVAEGRAAWDPGQRKNREAKNNPFERSFTPSYEADSQPVYDEIVADCDADPRGRICKRRLDKDPNQRYHLMLQGGRSQVRFGGIYPASKEDGGPHGRAGRPGRGESIVTFPGDGAEGKPLSRKSAKRLKDGSFDWQARTQSALLRRQEVEERPEKVIADAIARYMAKTGQNVFTVPDTIPPLLSAGMPQKVAELLITRAARKQYRKGVIMAPRTADLEDVLISGLGAVLKLRFLRGGKAVLTVPDPTQPGKELELKKVAVQFEGEAKPGLITDDIDSLHEEFEREGDEGSFEDYFIEQLENEVGDDREAATFFFTFSSLKGDVRVAVSVREHSKLLQPATTSKRVGYRYLKSVTLDDLPALLASISSRKRRKGRRLPRMGSP